MKNISFVFVAVLALAPLGCKQARKVQVQQTVEEAPRVASVIHMGDAKAETQLVSGFYGIEGNAWRWAARQFTVILRPPFGASQRGGTLQLNLTIPQVVIDKLKTLSLTAAIDGSPLAPETYTQPGPYTYKRDVPGNLLTADSVKVDFQLDKAIPPSGQDQRELGVVVNSVSLEAK
jgi:hypothetical protein